MVRIAQVMRKGTHDLLVDAAELRGVNGVAGRLSTLLLNGIETLVEVVLL